MKFLQSTGLLPTASVEIIQQVMTALLAAIEQ